MFFWKRKKKINNPITQLDPKGIKERVGEMEKEDVTYPEDPIFDGKSFMTVSDILIKDYQNKGGFDDLPGGNKPLEIQSGDVFTSILKNANVLPRWIELQHEIRDDIQKLLKTITWQDVSDIQTRVEQINKKITQYNQLVPSSIIQKAKVTKERLAEDCEKWK